MRRFAVTRTEHIRILVTASATETKLREKESVRDHLRIPLKKNRSQNAQMIVNSLVLIVTVVVITDTDQSAE